MSEHPGIMRTLSRKLYDSVGAAGRTVVLLAGSCNLMLLLAYFSGPNAFLYAVSSLAGLGMYMFLLSDDDEGTTIEDITESRALQFVLTLLLFTYFNAVVFMSMLFGLVAYQLGYPAIAVIVGALYPAYDSEIAKIQAPLSIAGALMVSLTIVAKAIESVEQLVNADYAQELLSDIASLRDQSTENVGRLLQQAGMILSGSQRLR